MRVAVCDDLTEAIADLEKKLEKIEIVDAVDVFTSLSAFSASLKTKRYDICFMDIDWGTGNVNGIEFAESMGAMPVIFVTAYPMEFAEKIFDKRLQPAGFLMKPVKEEQLQLLVEKIRRQKEEGKKDISIKTNGKVRVVAIDSIMFLESSLHKTRVNLSDGEMIELTGGLAKNKGLFPSCFVDCHKSYLVNPSYIERFASTQITLKNGTVISVSRAKSVSAKAQFMEYAQNRL